MSLQTAPAGTVVKQSRRFLTDNPVRAFRNAVAHGNWQHKPDFCGLAFWARRGDDPMEALTEFEVSQNELNVWQIVDLYGSKLTGVGLSRPCQPYSPLAWWAGF
jgi:hypothetical protein